MFSFRNMNIFQNFFLKKIEVNLIYLYAFQLPLSYICYTYVLIVLFDMSSHVYETQALSPWSKTWPPTRPVFFRKSCLMFTAFIKEAVYYERESTPQTSVTNKHSSSPTMKLVIIATIIQSAKHHTEMNFFVLGFQGYISFWTWFGCQFPGPSLAGQGGSVHHLIMFISHKNRPQMPSQLPRKAFLWPALQLLCSSVFHCPYGCGIHSWTISSPRWSQGFWLSRRNREGRCCSLGCSELQEHSG